MSDLEDEHSPRYVVVESDRYEADRDQAALSYNYTSGPDYATRWYVRLALAMADLTDFPGPLSHARDEEASAHYGREVRRFLYYGPTRRRTGTPARILFFVLPPDPDEPPETAESVIFLLRLLHGSQTLTPEEPAEG